MHSEADATVGADSKTLPNDGDLHSENPSISAGVNKLQEVNSKIPKSSPSQRDHFSISPFDPASPFTFLGLKNPQQTFTSTSLPLHSKDPSFSVDNNKLQEVKSVNSKSSSSQHNRSPSPSFDPASAFAFLGLETSQHSFTPAPLPLNEDDFLDELRYEFIESVIDELLPKSENSQVELELTTSIPSTSAGINAPNVPPLTSAGCKKSSKPLRKRKKEQKDDRAASKFKKLKRVSLTETTTTVEEMEHSNNEPMECEDSSK